MRSENQTIDQSKVSFIETARRGQIIDCAIEAIADLGFAQTSLAQIAKRAGVSTGVILYYFASKDDLIRAVAAHVYETGGAFIRPLVNREDTPRGALLAFVRASVGFVGARPNLLRAMTAIVRAGPDPAGVSRYDPAILSAREQGFRDILAWGQRTGAFRTFSIAVMTATIIEAIDFVPQALANQPDLDLAAYASELVELFDRATRADPQLQEPAIR